MKNKFAALAVLYLLAAPAQAHRDGCHRWHSCPSDHGTYTCGDLGYTTYCGTETTETSQAPAHTYTPPTPPAPSAYSPPEVHPTRYTKTTVNLRVTPSVSSQAIARMTANVPVKIQECAKGWCKVIVYNGYKGYVAQDYLRP